MAFWAAAAPALIGAGGSLLSGLFGRKDRKQDQRQSLEDQLRLMREQNRMSQVGLDSPWRNVRWQGPENNRRQVVTLDPSEQGALDQHRDFRSQAMGNWDPRGGWKDQEMMPGAAGAAVGAPQAPPAPPDLAQILAGMGGGQVPGPLADVMAQHRRRLIR